MTGVETKRTKTRNYFRIKYKRKTAYQAGVIIWLKYGSKSMKTSSKRYPVLKDKTIAEVSFAEIKSTEQTSPARWQILVYESVVSPRVSSRGLIVPRSSDFFQSSLNYQLNYQRVWLRSDFKYTLLSLAALSLRIRNRHKISLSVYQNATFDKPLLSYLFKAVDHTLKWSLFIFIKSSATQFSQQSLLPNKHTNDKLVNLACCLSQLRRSDDALRT